MCVLRNCGELAGGSPVGVVVKQPCSWWPAVGETLSLERHDKGALGVEQVTGPQHEANSAASLPSPSFGWDTCRSRAWTMWAKAMEGVLILDSALMDLPAYGKWNGYIVRHGTGEIRLDPETKRLSGCCPMVPGGDVIDKPRGETVGCRAEVGGGSSSGDGRDNITRPERRASSQVCRQSEDEATGLPCGLVTRHVCFMNRRGSLDRWSRLVAQLNTSGRLPGGKPDVGELHLRFGKGALETG